MLRRIVVLCTALALAAGTSAGAADVQGGWTARIQKEHPGKVYFSLQTGHHRQYGQLIEPRVLRGLTSADIESDAGASVRFELVRDAGTVRLEGSFQNGRGMGDFTFVPDEGYWNRLRALGVRSGTMTGDDERDLFELAMIDVSTDFIRSMQDIGYHETLDKYVAFKIFDVTPAYVREMASLGFDHLSAEKLTETRIHGATPEYIREMRAAGNDLSLDDYIQSRIFNITPEFAAEMGRAGYPDVDRDMLVQFRIHGVTPQFIEGLRQIGYSSVTAQKLVEMRIFGITPEFIRRANKAAGRRLPPSKLVEMRIFHVEPETLGKTIDD